MADENSSPRPFRRERNLSNRNFNKRGSNRRRFSTESHSSAEFKSVNNSPAKDYNTVECTSANNSPAKEDTTANNRNDGTGSGTTPIDLSSITLDFTFSTDSNTDDTLYARSELRTQVLDINLDSRHDDDDNDHDDNRHSAGISHSGYGKQLQIQTSASTRTSSSPQTPDPALLGVKQKLLIFENLKLDEQRNAFKSSKYKSKSTQSLLDSERANSSSPPASASSSKIGSLVVNVYPTIRSGTSMVLKNASIEEHSEDEVDSLKDEINEDYVQQMQDEFGKSTITMEHEVKEESVPVAAINKSFLLPVLQHSKSHDTKVVSPGDEKGPVDDNDGVTSITDSTPMTQKTRNKDFPRNYRSRPKTEVIDVSTEPLLYESSRFHSLHSPKPKSAEPDDDEQIELRDKGVSFVRPILEELIKTEETYVENLWIGINNYGKIFERLDLPAGLRGKKFVLFGNIEQIAEFHRDELLPMFHRNKHDLKRLFDEFIQYVDNNYFYGYVLFTMNKQRSLKLCEVYKNYFKLLQTEIDDKLGINSFLVQPIQRMARYPLLMQQFISTLFKNSGIKMKPFLESSCRLEKKLRNLLTTTNESEVINDIVCTGDANEFNTFYQGKFRKVSDFHCFDHTLKRGYRSKVFIFDKCIIYTEIKGKQLIFHGRYPCEHVGIVAKTKQFTLFYEHRKQQECDFSADPALIDQWLELIRDMIKSYAEEERQKMKELHSHEFGGDHMHRKPANLSLFRDSNRFSSDSGIGNIWVVPKPEQEDATNNRTTWYALT